MYKIFKNDVINLNCIFSVLDSIFAWGAHQVCTYVVVSQQGEGEYSELILFRNFRQALPGAGCIKLLITF